MRERLDMERLRDVYGQLFGWLCRSGKDFITLLPFALATAGLLLLVLFLMCLFGDWLGSD